MKILLKPPAPQEFEVNQFVTNNDPDEKNMNALVRWVNAGAYVDSPHAWHNGTNIFLCGACPGLDVANVGDWIVRDPAGRFSVMDDDTFEQKFGLVTSAA